VAEEPDSRLIERFIRGDQDAFESIFRQFEHEVFRWILRIVRDPAAAEDAVVEAFWRAYRSRARFDAARSFGAWMRRIATNVALNHVRDTRRERTWTSLDANAPAPSGTDVALRDAVTTALHALPRRLYVVAVLALVEQQSYADIAEALDLPVGTVKSRVFRATRALRQELARLGIER
jgi:RNA polymerase sigma-70 factor (ECF subfamily)